MTNYIILHNGTEEHYFFKPYEGLCFRQKKKGCLAGIPGFIQGLPRPFRRIYGRVGNHPHPVREHRRGAGVPAVPRRGMA